MELFTYQLIKEEFTHFNILVESDNFAPCTFDLMFHNKHKSFPMLSISLTREEIEGIRNQINYMLERDGGMSTYKLSTDRLHYINGDQPHVVFDKDPNSQLFYNKNASELMDYFGDLVSAIEIGGRRVSIFLNTDRQDSTLASTLHLINEKLNALCDS